MRGSRIALLISVGAQIACPVAEGQPNLRFDAVCTEVLPAGSTERPDHWRLRIDLEHRLWCLTLPDIIALLDMGKCDNLEQLRYDINTVTLRDYAQRLNDGSQNVGVMTLNRRSGALLSQSGTVGSGHDKLKSELFDCKRAAFSGFPAPTF
jgi:hypothetical protein